MFKKISRFVDLTYINYVFILIYNMLKINPIMVLTNRYAEMLNINKLNISLL